MQTLDYEKIGQRIKSARKNAEYTQEALSEKIDCTSRYLSSIENGKRKPSLELLVKISSVLNVSIDSLLRDSPCTYGGYLVKCEIPEKVNRLDKPYLIYLEKTLDALIELQQLNRKNAF